MRVGEPVHVVKFIAKVEEERVEDMVPLFQSSIAPVLRRSCFGEVLLLARRRELEKLDPEGPGIAGSQTLRSLVREARPHEAGLEQVLRRLESRPGGHILGGFAYAMRLHNMKEKNPAEYRRLRESHLAETRRGGPPDIKLDVPGLGPWHEPVPYETVTFWRTEDDARAGVEWLAGTVPETFGDALYAYAAPEKVFVPGERGEVLVRA